MAKNKTRKTTRWLRVARLGLLILLIIGLPCYLIICYFLADFYTKNDNHGKIGAYFPSYDGLTYQDISFQSKAKDNPTIRGWFIPHSNSSKVLIKAHGSRGDRTNFLELNKPLWESGYNLLLFDFQGHGLSDGERFSYCEYERYDLLNAVDFLKSKGFKSESIGIIGWSMGAACSLMAMSLTNDIKAGVFDSAYGDLARVGYHQLGGPLIPFYFGATIMSRVFWDMDVDIIKPEIAITQLGKRHVMLIQGDSDSVVPVGEAYYLLKAAGDKTVTDFWIVPGANHVQAYFKQPDAYLRRVVKFFDKELA